MNTPNNKKRKNSQHKIGRAFIQLVQYKNLNEISVTDICKDAKINRSTFYANYLDVYDLADKIKDEMFNNILQLYPEEALSKIHSYDYLKLFKHIKDNQIYYNTLFKLNFDFSEYYNIELEEKEALKFFGTTKNVDYHIEFFKAGINALMKKWLQNGCKETPEELNEILENEYKGRI